MGPLTSSYVLCGSREANEGKLFELSPPAGSGRPYKARVAKLPRLATGKASTLLASLALACAKA